MSKLGLFVSVLFLLFILGYQNPHVIKNSINWPYIIMPFAVLLFLFRGNRLRSITMKDMTLVAFPWLIGAFCVFVMMEFDKVKQQSGQEGSLKTVTISADQDGHFHIEANVNNLNTVHFMVDTGASRVVLTKIDALSLGIDPKDLTFNQVTSTANGISTAAPIVLESIQIGDIVLRNVKASVANGDLNTSLLGQTFLNQLHSYQVYNGSLRMKN